MFGGRRLSIDQTESGHGVEHSDVSQEGPGLSGAGPCCRGQRRRPLTRMVRGRRSSSPEDTRGVDELVLGYSYLSNA
jgi:hypothetical protein